MSLYPGGRKQVGAAFVAAVDDPAQLDSMALAIETHFNDLFLQLKGKAVPDALKEDRRILFTAIARGVLDYLRTHGTGNVRTVATSTLAQLNVAFDVNLDHP